MRVAARHERLARRRARLVEWGGFADQMRTPAHDGNFANHNADAAAKAATRLRPVRREAGSGTFLVVPVGKEGWSRAGWQKEEEGEEEEEEGMFSDMAVAGRRITAVIRERMQESELAERLRELRRRLQGEVGVAEGVRVGRMAELTREADAAYVRTKRGATGPRCDALIMRLRASTEVGDGSALSCAWLAPSELGWRSYPILDYSAKSKFAVVLMKNLAGRTSSVHTNCTFLKKNRACVSVLKKGPTQSPWSTLTADREPNMQYLHSVGWSTASYTNPSPPCGRRGESSENKCGSNHQNFEEM